MSNKKSLSSQDIINLYTEKTNYGAFHRSLFVLISLIAPIINILGYYSVITGFTPNPVLYFVLIGVILLILPFWMITVFPKHFKAQREIGFRNFSKSPFVSMKATIQAFKPRPSEPNFSIWMKFYYLALAGWGIFLVTFVFWSNHIY